MKSALWITVIVLLAGVLVAQTQPRAQTPSQTAQESQPQVYGRGRGGAPFAWNDRNRDGICDVTGRPVSPAWPVGLGRGWNAWGDRDGDGICDFTGWPVGRGRGAVAWGGWGRGRGRGVAGGWGRRGGVWARPANLNAPAPASPVQP